MRKKIIVFSSILVVVLFALMWLLFSPRYNCEVKLEEDINVQGGVAQSEELEYVIVIPEDDEYVMHADWEISPAGLLMGYSMVDENGKDVNTFTADWITMDSAPMELAAGKYTMTLTFITNEEQWKEYFADFDTTDWDEAPGAESGYQFASDGEFHLEFDFILEKYSNIWSLATVLAVIIGVLLIILLIAATQTDDSMRQKYDERQELLRGRGFKYAFYTMMILNFILFTLETAEVYLPMSTGFALFFSAIIGVGVYAVYCIWKDAYFALNQRASTFMAIFFVMGTMNLLMGINAFVEGIAIQNNQLTFRSMNLFCGILMLVVCGALILKKVCKDREEE